MYLNKYTELALTHRDFFGIKGNNSSNQFLVAHKNGEITIFMSNAIAIKKLSLNMELKAVDFLPQENLMGYITIDQLVICNLDQEPFLQQKGVFKCLYFHPKGKLVFIIERLSAEEVLLVVRSLDDFEIVTSLNITDEIYESDFTIDEGADDDSFILWMAGGQDGQISFQFKLTDNEIELFKFDKEDTTPPVFNLLKDEYVMVDEEIISIFNIDGSIKDEIQIPDDFHFTYGFVYLDNQKLICTGEQGLSLIDTQTGKIDEIIIEGHEPKPVSDYYLTLDDDDLTTDIESVLIFAETILVSCRNHQKKEEQYSILIFSKTEVEKILLK